NSDRRATEKYADQIRDELNVKKVTIDPPGVTTFCLPTYVPNQGAISWDFGRKASQVIAALRRMSREDLLALGQSSGSVPVTLPSGEVVSLNPLSHLEYTLVGAEGWTVVNVHG